MSQEKFVQVGFRGIAAGKPENLRRWTVLNLKVEEIAVLGDDRRASLRCGLID